MESKLQNIFFSFRKTERNAGWENYIELQKVVEQTLTWTWCHDFGSLLSVETKMHTPFVTAEKEEFFILVIIISTK